MKKAQNQAKRIKHLMTKFMTEDQATVEYDTENWVKYASTVKAKLDATRLGVKLRTKAVYDNKNYVSWPNYVPFVERMDIETSTLEISSIDKMTKEEPDQEVTVANPLDFGNSTVDKNRTDASVPGAGLDNLVAAVKADTGLPF
jgi:hypothetical protein